MLDNAMLFVQVVQAGSFTKAADVLYRSKSSISRKISQLEQQLDLILIQRTAKGIRLTKQGEQFYQSCLTLKNQFESAKDDLQQQQHAISGHIAMTAPMSLGSLYLGPLISHFLTLYPDITIELELSDKAKQLDDSHYDLAIRAASSLPDSNMHAKQLHEYDYVIAGSPAYFKEKGYPSFPNELANYHVITCITTHDPKLHSHWSFSVSGQPVNIAIKSRAKVTHMWVQKQFALDGLGLIRVPRYWVRDELEENCLQSVLGNYLQDTSKIYALYQTENKDNRRIKALINYLSIHLPNAVNNRVLINQEGE